MCTISHLGILIPVTGNHDAVVTFLALKKELPLTNGINMEVKKMAWRMLCVCLEALSNSDGLTEELTKYVLD